MPAPPLLKPPKCTSCAGVAAEAAGTAEAASARTESAVSEPCGTVAANLVVLFALLLIGEHVVCFRDFLELLLCCRVAGVQVRVVSARELAVRLLDVSFQLASSLTPSAL